jgi:hypothetical protein
MPAAPVAISAERRGDDVIVQFTVPTANTDNTRPANVSEVEVLAFTGTDTVRDAELLKHGTRVGSVSVKKPRDPDQTVEPDESAADLDPLEGNGLDQGARGRVEEQLSAAAFVQLDPRLADERKRKGTPETAGPLLGPAPPAISTRTYVAVGISTRGRKGALSKRVAVPLVPPPPSPPSPAVTYSETAITVAWGPSEHHDTDVLPSHPLGVAAPTQGYYVYDVPPSIASGAKPASPDAVETRLTKDPIAETSYTDSRITWGSERCYAVRVVETIGDFRVESHEGPARCVTLTDKFPPAAPKGLSGVATNGAINLIWDQSPEKDLAGYVVLRAVAPATTLEPVTPEPIQATNFEDKVQPGIRYIYAIVAVDKAGNRSAPSNRLEETAR